MDALLPRAPSTAGLPAPDHSIGPEVLGLRGGPAHLEDGWHTLALSAAPGLDGPPGVLQGGLVAGLAVELARTIDRGGAALHGVDVRLEAPTPLGQPLTGRVRPLAGTALSEVELWSGAQRTASATVELTGPRPLLDAADLVELAAGPLTRPEPSELYPTCFVCGPHATHPAALHTYPRWVGPDRVSIPWIPEESLADVDARAQVRAHAMPVVADLVVAAALDCPTAWASLGAVQSAGYPAMLLGTLRLRMGGAVEVLDPLRITARSDGIAGRKVRARSALIDTDERVLALADVVHVAVVQLPTV
jgi:hypothetical protein